jgi:hypothetical protein
LNISLTFFSSKLYSLSNVLITGESNPLQCFDYRRI